MTLARTVRKLLQCAFIVTLLFPCAAFSQENNCNLRNPLVGQAYQLTCVWTCNLKSGLKDILREAIVSPIRRDQTAVQMPRFDVQNSQLPEDSITLPNDKSFYEEHTLLVWAMASLIAILMAFIVSLWVNIIRRKRIEEKFRETQRSMVTLMSNLPGMAYRCRNDEDYSLEFVSDGCRQLTGYSIEELTSGEVASLGKLVLPEDSQKVWNASQEAGAKHEPFEREYRIKRADGAVRWVWERGRGVYDRSGKKLVGFEGFISDAHERKVADQAIRDRERWFREIFDATTDAIYVHDKNTGRVIDVNAAGFKLLKYRTREDVVGKDLADLPFADPPYSAEDAVGWIRKAIAEGPQFVENWLSLTMDNEEIWSEASALYTNIAGRDCVLTILRDVTKRREAERVLKEKEEQLRQSQKMDLIGQLAGGIAHDFNNMLGGIIGSAELLAAELPDNVVYREYVDLIIKTSQRAADLTKKLLTFSRKAIISQTPFDVHQVIADTIAILSRSIDKRITLKTDLNAQSTTVIGDSSQLQNALMNLGVNARDAIHASGELTVSTENVVLDETYCEHSLFDLTPGNYICISVCDTGVGIPGEIKDRIFEPFFTTKETGKGTGLGLAAVYGTVKDHHGAITVYSELGKGTIFHLSLPLAPDQEIVSPNHGLPVEKGSGHVLLVDDEDVIRNTTGRMLQSYGYDVSFCSNGLEALEVYRQEHEKIDIVLIDVVMPKMSGMECFTEIRKINPEAKVIMSSGFAPDAEVSQLEKQGLLGFIRKPYRIEELLHSISKAMKFKH